MSCMRNFLVSDLVVTQDVIGGFDLVVKKEARHQMLDLEHAYSHIH